MLKDSDINKESLLLGKSRIRTFNMLHNSDNTMYKIGRAVSRMSEAWGPLWWEAPATKLRFPQEIFVEPGGGSERKKF